MSVKPWPAGEEISGQSLGSSEGEGGDLCCDAALEVQSITGSEDATGDWAEPNLWVLPHTTGSLVAQGLARSLGRPASVSLPLSGVPGWCSSCSAGLPGTHSGGSSSSSCKAVRPTSMDGFGERQPQCGHCRTRSHETGSASWPRPCRPSFGGSAAAEVMSLPDYRRGGFDSTHNRPRSSDVANELRRSASRLLLDVERIIGPEDCQSTFLCLVCFENQSRDQRLDLSACKVESHGCCKTCSGSFFRSRIEQGRVFELVCPVGAAEGGCALLGCGKEAALASREEVERCLAGDKATLLKYNRFSQTKIDPSLRECPDCGVLCGPVLDAVSGRPLPEMVCSSCSSCFCYYHAAAHRDGSCEEYEVRLAAETKVISETLGAKDCPRCTRQTVKSGGCNHMTCQVCRCDWCWACSERLTLRGPHGEDPIYWHYTDDNVESGCQQFAEPGTNRDAEAVRLWRRARSPGPGIRRLCMPVQGLSIVLLTLIAFITFALWVLFYGCSSIAVGAVRILLRCAYCRRKTEFPENWETNCSQLLVKPTLYFAVALGTISFLVPFILITLAWDAIAVVLWMVLLLLSKTPIVRRFTPATTRHHLRFFVTAPVHAVHQFGSATLAFLVDRGQERPPEEHE